MRRSARLRRTVIERFLIGATRWRCCFEREFELIGRTPKRVEPVSVTRIMPSP